jgi:3-isopropylmalate/(R)-2-methylmalate dehydratase small subunit
VIAPSFGDIFYSNTFKNGILPIALPRDVCDALMADARMGGNARLTVDLHRCRVVRPNGEEIDFTVDPFRRHMLLNGLDDIGQTLRHEAAITQFEDAARARLAWMPSLAAG